MPGLLRRSACGLWIFASLSFYTLVVRPYVAAVHHFRLWFDKQRVSWWYWPCYLSCKIVPFLRPPDGFPLFLIVGYLSWSSIQRIANYRTGSEHYFCPIIDLIPGRIVCLFLCRVSPAPECELTIDNVKFPISFSALCMTCPDPWMGSKDSWSPILGAG